ncbi:MAG: tRNA (guanosine(37)-N1)-methyltransferase TrmD [Cytophagales bacterium]|nr:tRNA (guanosine(37)-N1)-methyltransferase TrmD [Cytophagales bacterium]
MRIDIITLFPELIEPFLNVGITRRAFESKQIDVRLWQLRDYADGNYKRVDDRPFGGGPGMVMLAEPLSICLAAIGRDRHASPNTTCPVVLFSPIGQTMSQSVVTAWLDPNGEFGAGAILVCGRYEGLDQRFIDEHITHQLSLGDFVLSGGEIAAVALLDALARLQPGVLTDAQSHIQDSFNPAINGLLDCPHYTRPEVWRGIGVPEVLLSGNHAKIEAWRQAERLALTANLRPDLLQTKLP